MVRIRRRTIKNQVYYYLEHSIREKGRVQKKEKYIGKKVPKDIEKIKRDFLFEIYRDRWFSLFEKIKTNYFKEVMKTPKFAKEKEMETFAIRFTYDTQRIEGSTLSLRETADLLERGITPRTKPLQDVKEAEAHKKIFYDMLGYRKDLSLQIILHWHKRLFELTKPDVAGNIRQHQVAISGSRFIPPFPAEIYPLLKEFFGWYNEYKNKLHPVELAALAHLKFVTIHPFSDGNGRISRLIMNLILNKHRYPMLNISYENRTSYYNALERSQLRRNESIFLQWFFKRYRKEYERYLQSKS